MKTPAILIVFIFTAAESIAQAVPVSTGSKVNQKDAQDALDLHNKARQDVGVTQLSWSVELAKYAQAWADNLAKRDCAFEHRPHSGEFKQIHGENIFWGSGKVYNALDASKSWYDEIKDYKYGPIKSGTTPVVGHYTQMVWKSTTHVGIAQATCQDGGIIIVANYDPAGNYIGQNPY